VDQLAARKWAKFHAAEKWVAPLGAPPYPFRHLLSARVLVSAA
jgi:hypothetical protein